MRRSPAISIGFSAVLFASRASADEPLSQLSGRVSDQQGHGPVEGAFVFVAGPGGLDKTLTTDATGRYSVDVQPGEYRVVFAYGGSRSSGRVVVEPGQAATLDGTVDALAGEVIVIREKLRAPVPAKATNYKPHQAPPYSDEAILSDAWTKAWLLLDVDEAGAVRRMKFLRRPGYDLEKIATDEVFALRFDPARDASGKPIRTWVVWSIEWPSAWWLIQFTGTRSGMPPIVGFPPRRLDHYVPCAGSGPWAMGSIRPTYKDCSLPDLSKAHLEPWVAR
jgi:hypothetical protein